MTKVIFILFILLIIILASYDHLQVFFLNNLIVLRGILTPNCFYYNISNSSGINLFYKFKEKHGNIPSTYMFGKKIYVITKVNHIKYILNNSPYIFGPGKLKMTFFKSFMSENIGVSKGCKWAKLRKLNEFVLDSNKVHKYSYSINQNLISYIQKNMNQQKINYEDFKKIGKYFVGKIVFNCNNIDDTILEIFTKANNIKGFYFNFNLNPSLKRKYEDFLLKHIKNPNKNSLIYLLSVFSKEYTLTEIMHQIPHLMFPINGLFTTTIPRLLLILINHKNILKKLISKIKNIDTKNIYSIYENYYLRACVLEMLRLNNPVVTTFRTTLKDIKLDNKIIKKDSQLLILNNPILRDKTIFKNPNRYIPERWNKDLEKSYYSISFNQGPQICPGKELSILIIQCFLVNFLKINGVFDNIDSLKSKKINIDNIPEMINPCKITLYKKKIISNY